MYNNMSDGRLKWPRIEAVEEGWSAETSECQTIEHQGQIPARLGVHRHDFGEEVKLGWKRR
jgi:hypothetical protein